MKKYIGLIGLSLISLFSCDSLLEEKDYSELDGKTYLTTTKSKEQVLLSAYGNADQRQNSTFYTSEMTSGETWGEYGVIEASFTPLSNFTWNSDHEFFSETWNSFYRAIRDANIVIANTENSDNKTEQQYLAEAKFIRGYSYAYLHDWFGGLPLYKSPKDNLYLEKSSDEATINFIIKDLQEAAEVLPITQDTYGKATKGAALGVLTWVYLNFKQWQKAADTAKKVIDLHAYALFPDYTQLFRIENEGNSEMIWVNQANPQVGVPYIANIFPTDYPHLQNQTLYASRVHLYDDFVNSFASEDVRKELIVTSYTNTSGKFIQLLGDNRCYPGKYEFDKNAVGGSYGNDVPVLRYADILLMRSEALNELQGPNDESLELLNQIRERAKVAPYTSSQLATKDLFRTALFKERRWEFFFEQKYRTDQIRQGVFISEAKKRGKTAAQDYQTLFPIPQSELDANPALVQNNGYEVNK